MNEMRLLSNSGTIYERDITTIGGRDSFSRGQTPVYRSGNFVITINGDDRRVGKSTSTKSWENNNETDGNVWTLDNMGVQDVDNPTEEKETVEITRNPFDLRNFAYDGSCQELFRASINDLVKKFPGELYIPYKEITEYLRSYSGSGYTDTNGITVKKEGNKYYYLNGNEYTGAVKTATISDKDIFHSLEEVEKAGLNYHTEPTTFEGADGIVYTETWSKYSEKVGNVAYYNVDSDDPQPIGRSGNTQLYEVSNPLGINAVYENIYDEDNPIRYINRDKNYKEYELIDPSGNTYDITLDVLIGGTYSGSSEMSFSATTASQYILVPSPGGSTFDLVRIDKSQRTTEYEEIKNMTICPGQKVGEMRLMFLIDGPLFTTSVSGKTVAGSGETDASGIAEVVTSRSFTRYRLSGDTWSEGDVTDSYSSIIFSIYLGDNGQFHYLYDMKDVEESGLLGAHIRPKHDYIMKFYNGLDTFEKVLINPYTEPIYTSTFNVLEEDEYGESAHLQAFTFPTDGGGFNIMPHGIAFEGFVERLREIGEYYDMRYSDVIWRAMTHEAIKNLDWTLDKRNETDVDETHATAYRRIDKTLRTMGRFFDEIMFFSEGLKTTNTITYDKDDNLSDAFLVSNLNEHGWDIVQITPFLFREKELITDESGNIVVIPFTWDGYGFDDTIKVENNNGFIDEESGIFQPLKRIFSRDNETEGIRPYYLGGRNDEWDDEWKYVYTELCTDQGTWNDYDRDYTATPGYVNIQRAIKRYGSEELYSYPQVNTEFMRRLAINTKAIIKKKGTLEGIESLLSLFGMKSKRFANKLGEEEYDYEINEYVAKIDECILDEIPTGNEEYLYDEINQFKDIAYDTPEYRNGINIPYYGIPVAYYQADNKRYIYPYFDKNEQYDGDPYYQMNGGWLQKLPYTYDIDDNIVAYDKVGDAFSETVKDVISVRNVKELINLPYYTLKNNDVAKVEDISGFYVVIDGVIYDVSEDIDGNKFVSSTVNDSSVTIGNTVFYNSITVSVPNGVKTYNLSDGHNDGADIRIYVNLTGDTTIKAYSNVTSISRVSIYDGRSRIEEGYTNYFSIRDAYSAGELSDFGWRQLKTTDEEYYRINNLRNINTGNNPHKGSLSYDNGTSYVTQFSKLFRYSSDNNLFSERLYEKYTEEVSEIVDSFGFNMYTDSSESAQTLTYSDCYGQYTLLNGDGLTNKDNKVAIQCVQMHNTFDAATNSDSIVITEPEHDKYDGVDTGALKGETVINTKRIDINFYIYVMERNELKYKYDNDRQEYLYTEEAQAQIKYIEEVILPYLTQMIPSSSICRINYKYQEVKN